MPVNNNNVKFVSISRAKYTALTKDDNTFYVVSETNGDRLLYLGSTPLPDTPKYVTTNTTQEITASKTFVGSTTNLNMDGGSVNYVRPSTTGGWARGFWWSTRPNDANPNQKIGGIGVLGSSQTVSKFYIGYGVEPWTNSILEAFPSYVNINGGLRKQNKEVAILEDILQANWNETNTASKAFILNKPTIPSIAGLATETYVDNEVDGAKNYADNTFVREDGETTLDTLRIGTDNSNSAFVDIFLGKKSTGGHAVFISGEENVFEVNLESHLNQGGRVPTNTITADTSIVNLQYLNTETAKLVPNTRKINGKQLNADVTLTAADVEARPSSWNPDLTNYVTLTGAAQTITSQKIFKNQQTQFEHTSMPALFTRNTTATGSTYGGFRLDRIATGANPVNGFGVGVYFGGSNAVKTNKFMGMFGGRHAIATNNSEVGEIIFGPAWLGADPYARADVRIRARSASLADLYVNGKVYINSASGTAGDELIPSTRKINGKQLNTDITLTAADVEARPSDWNPDLTGLATETYVNTKVATKQNIVVKGTVDTLVGTVAKTTTIPGYTLTVGDLLYITFTYGNTSSNTTLNINGSGAKNITLGKRNVTGGSGTGSFHLASGAGVLLYYDGVSFVLPGSQDQTDANSTYSVISDTDIDLGTATTGRLVSAKVLRDNFYIKSEIPTAIQTYLLGLPVNP